MAAEKKMSVVCSNGDCVKVNNKYLKVKESRKVLRHALKLLEAKCNELQVMATDLQKAHEEALAQGKINKEKMLEKSNEVVSLKSELSAVRSKIPTLMQKCEGLEVLQANLADTEKEIERLKGLWEEEKIRVDSMMKNVENEKEKAAETGKLLEAQKKISTEKDIQITRVAAEKDKEYKPQLASLEKEIAEAKMKLASEESKIQEATKIFEAEWQKLLAEKRIAESEAEKAQERVEVAKQEAASEKQRAGAVLVKAEEHKKLAEDNFKKAMEAECLATQISQKIAEDEKTIEELHQKIHELSSLSKPSEISGGSSVVHVNAESAEVKLLKNRLKLQKLRTRQARDKFKNERMKLEREERRRRILQHEISRLRLDCMQILHRFDMLDATFSPASGSIDGKSQLMPTVQKSSVMHPTTQACRERISDASNNSDEVDDDNLMKLLDLENAADEELYRRAMDAPLLASFPELETFNMDNLVEARTESLQNQLRNFCLVVSDREDNSNIFRTLCAARNCIARCSLDTQTEWAVDSILTAVEGEEMPSQKEKHSVLLTLLLFNFMMTTAMKFGKFGGGNSVLILNSYSEHIHRVITDADTRILFLEHFSLHELLPLIEDFLIDGKAIFENIVPMETSSECDLRNNFLDGFDTLSFEVASNEELVGASIILASLCAETDHVGFISEASYNILRLCRWDSLTVLTILHVFANLGGRKYFELGNRDLVVIVLKSLVMLLEERSISVTTASCLPSIHQLHTELCTNVKCPFLEGAESIDIVLLLLLEKIKKCLFQQAEQFDSSNFRFLSNNSNAGQWSNQEVVAYANSMNCDAPCCLEKRVTCPTQPNVLINATMCQLSDILSLLELVANKMSWQWTNVKLVPQLLHMLDSCVVENFAIAIIVLLGQLGRLGVDVGGYEDQGVERLRHNLLSYLCGNSSMKAGPSLQIATASTLFGLLPIDFETLLQTESSLPAYSSKPVSDDVGNLRKWFSGLDKNQQDLLYGILRCPDVR